MKKIILAFVFILMLAGCDQCSARSFGGDYTIVLPKGRRLVQVSWKESDLWVLTREMEPGETPVNYELQEDSTYGVLEGTVTIREQN